MKTNFFILTQLIILLMIATPFVLESQPFKMLPDSNATWVTEYITYDGFGGIYAYIPEYYFLKPFKDDTTINSYEYHKLFRNDSVIYMGAYRNEASGKVWYIPKDSLKEYILYDFNVSLNDTIYNIYGIMMGNGKPVLFNAVVQSVSNFNIGNGYFVKRIEIYAIWNNLNGLNVNTVWYEKIGEAFGIITTQAVRDLIYFPYRYCVDIYDTIFTPCCAPGNCDRHPTLGFQSLKHDETQLIAAPNPATTSIILTLQNNRSFSKGSVLNIFNYLGSLVFSEVITETNNDRIILDLSKYSKGIYFIHLYDKEKTGGIYRTTDQGQNWEKIAMPNDFGGTWTVIIKLLINPDYPDILYAVTTNGLYLCNNCNAIGSPFNWERKITDCTYDLEVKQDNSNILYASVIEDNFKIGVIRQN